MTRPCPHGSEPDRASSTSAACARSSSTGCSRATTGGEFRLRIENTDTSREVAEAVDQIQESLRWLGLDWDGAGDVPARPHRRLPRGRAAARRRGEGVRGRGRDPLPHARRGRDRVGRRRPRPRRVPEREARGLVLVRSDGRPTYNFASPIEDVWDGITHVIRGDDHISNTPKQINIIRARRRRAARLRARPERARRRTARSCRSATARPASTSSASRATSPHALVNFLALLGWGYDGETTIMRRDELVERFTLERVDAEPGAVRLREARLDERRLPARAAAGGVRATRSSRWLARAGLRLGRGARAQGGAARAGEDRAARRVPGVRRLPLRATVEPDPAAARRRRADRSRRRARRSPALEPFTRRGDRGGAPRRSRSGSA